ncbi:MAG: bifunctional UDP-3-O-[Bacteroidaceae bacterium]|nr:bifunctional UDP-3-O-[3-hydroxymyristoyl] N-acetylglucosamine deacetylase/3-hydroxyacyl-ACP dehydratase [Bacteroidaceae bacterium]
MLKQNTLKESFSLSGKGLHTGLNLTVTFLPAPAGHGYKIQRVDMPGQPIMDAVAENVVDTQRGTVLGKGKMRCSTVEHALAALYALGIDNVLIQADGPEFPILDGSAEPFVREIQRVGFVEQDAPKDYYYITKKMEFRDDKTGACITLLPDEDFSITCMIAFDGKVLSSQFATLDNMDKFATEVAGARTFVFVREIEQLLMAGLIKGGDLDNAIVIYERQTTQENLDKLCKLTGAEHHDANVLGYIQHKPLVWDNEPARHKLLDIIGDMALIGKPIKGRIIATRPGHTVNNMFARMMRKEIRKHDVQAPKYDPNQAPLMDINKIKTLLPHRFPMQLVDKVIDIKENYIVAVKNVTSDEPFFQGHFPDDPVMPGVLLIEAMAQTGGLLVLYDKENPETYSTYFLRIDNVKFRQKVVPGDTLIFRVEQVEPLHHSIGTMQGYAFIGENCIAEATFTAQVIVNKKEIK